MFFANALPSNERLYDQLRTVQRIAQIGFWEIYVEDRLTGKYISWSEEASAILDIEHKYLPHNFERFASCLHPVDRERVLNAIDRAVRNEKSLDVECRIKRPSGEVRHVHSRGDLTRGDDGQTVLFGTVQDITERILRQQETEQNALLLQIASRMSHIGGWKFDVGTDQVIWSDEVCTIHEVTCSASPTLQEAITFYAPECRQKIQALFFACIKNGVPYDEELQIITVTGRRVWVRAIGKPVRDVENTITGIQGAFQDISDKKRSEENAQLLEQRLTTTLDSITDAFYTLDRQWRFTYLNKEAERLFQKPREECLGKVMWKEFSALQGQIGYREFHRAVQQNCTVAFEEFYAPYHVWSEVRAYPSEEGLTVYFRDITEAKKTQKALQISEERFRIIAKSTNDALWDCDLISNTNWRSETVLNLFGYTPQDFEGPMKLWSDRIHPDDRGRVLDSTDAALKGKGDRWSDEYRFIRKDGSIANVLDRGFIIRDSEGKATRIMGAMVDLTERREADARLREQASLLDKAKDAIVVRGLDNRVHYWNKGAERLYGWTAEEAIGRSVEELLYEDPTELHNATRRVIELGEWSGEITERRKNGTTLPVEAQWTLVRDEAGQPKSIFAIKTDISLRKAAERRVQQLAFYDPLTQLPNRQLLMERLERAIAACTHSGHVSALMFIDLDDFKSLNDTLGHATGDLLLQQVARRLTNCVSDIDTVARFGGDEFVVLLEQIGGDFDEAAARTMSIGEGILEALNQGYQLGDYKHNSTPSIGITLFEDDKVDMGELLKRADMAMYQAKAAGRNSLRFFDPRMQAAVSARMSLEADVRQGLYERQFLLHYQPQVDRTGRITGVEALIRWQHPKRGMVSPLEFIQLAEETGLILPLGEWVLQTACQQLAAWAALPKLANLEIAVNVSARQFHHPGFVEQVLGALALAGVDPRRLKLELTESMLFDDLEDTISKMSTLKARGVSFALDDFGTGYSSLVYLKRLPLDVLKIDRSFVCDLLTNANDAAIARTIIALGSNLGLKIIAEGVETEGQRDFLFQHGCDAYQGYLCTKPLPAEAVAAVIAAQTRATHNNDQTC
jgi:diguanylate cyclase (GGDEF)-like protein/PAS domain S-box-containing protein